MLGWLQRRKQRDSHVRRCSDCGARMFYFTDCSGRKHWGCIECASARLDYSDTPCLGCQ